MTAGAGAAAEASALAEEEKPKIEVKPDIGMYNICGSGTGRLMVGLPGVVVGNDEEISSRKYGFFYFFLGT